jgi:hypothetical protein
MGDKELVGGDEWQSQWLDAVYRLAKTLEELSQSNPWPQNPLLPQAINDLMTELWDCGFSQTEIREAFEAAIGDLPRYAAGEEVRS